MGNAFVTGDTTGQFPTTTDAYQSSFGGGTYNAFITEVQPDGSGLVYSTYLLDSQDDFGHGIATDLYGNFVVTGGTKSSDFPTAHAFQGSNGGGTEDAFLAMFSALPPPAVTGISTDTGSSSTDQITTDQTLSLSGTSVANATVKVYRAGVGLIGTTTANGSGNWTLDYTCTSLPEGIASITSTATASGIVSVWSSPSRIKVDLTPPVVTLTTDATTTDLTPEVRVVATDLNGLPNGTTVAVDVDLNNDGEKWCHCARQSLGKGDEM